MVYLELVTQSSAMKKVFLNILQNLQENSFFIDAVWRYTTILKKGNRNFQEYLFCETPANGCFCI